MRRASSRSALGLACALLVAACMPGRAHTQELSAAPDSSATLSARGAAGAPPRATEIVRYAPPPAVTIAAGGAATVQLTFHVVPPWHINAHKPNDAYLIPTALTLPPAGGVTPGVPTYPAALQAHLSFSDTPLAVYSGDFTIAVPLTAAAGTAPGKQALKGTLHFQSCNDQMCLPPATIPVAVDVTVRAGAPVASISTSAPPPPAPEVTVTAPTPTPVPAAPAPDPAAGLVTRWFAEHGALFAFVIIFFAGLGLNLTPCVYPMMGVTISLFGAGAGAGAAPGKGGAMKALPRALVYVLGICLMYTTLGVIAALSGSLFGGWLANPWVLGGIGVLLLAMALSMFGLYELQMPSGLLSKLGGAAGASLFGTFLAGLLVGVFASPCIGPPIIGLLAYVGAKGDPVFGFWAFFVLSLGLGLPYLVLAVSSGLLARLPRSGSWMDWAKHLFGVILLAWGANYLCLAIAPAKAGWVLPAALGVGGLYLGFLEPTGRDRTGFRRFKWAVGVAAIAVAVILAYESPAPAVTWDAYSDAALAQARADGKPVVLDFSAEWCMPCRKLEKETFTDAGVRRALSSFVTLKVDMTRFDSPASLALRKRFDIHGVPTIVFLSPDGREVTDVRTVEFDAPASFRARAERVRRGGS